MQITKLQATQWAIRQLAYVTEEVDDDDEAAAGSMRCEDTAAELAHTLTTILEADKGFAAIVSYTRYSNDEVNEDSNNYIL